MDIKLSEEQTQLQDSAARYMDKECTFDFVRKIENDSELGYSPEMWKTFAEMGWLGINLPEAYGGMGMSLLDNVILVRELGRHICPSPLIPTVVTAGDAIARAGTEEQKSTLLPEIVGGEKIYAFAYQEYSRHFHPSHIKLEAKEEGDSYVLNGGKMFVEFAAAADTLLVVARTGDTPKDKKDSSGLTMFLVPRDSAGIEIKHLPTMARDRHYEVKFNKVKVPKTNMLGKLNDAWTDLEPVINKTAVVFCAYTNGAGLEMHAHATQYAKDRVQFGRPIGQMQVIQMYLAQLIMELYGADTLTLFTAFNMDKDRHVRGYVGKMKAFCAETVGRVMDIGSQIFGGMGYMEEQDTTLFLRRGKQYQLSLGGTEYWEEVIAEEIIDRDPVVLS
jgi:alkylation response protein AidB-like acyl-CoA dehydrogenase